MKKSIWKTSLMTLVVLLVLLPGCFTNAVDKSFMGYTAPGGDPVHENREVLGHVLVPFSFVLDVATSPIQLLSVIVCGDQAVYDPLSLGYNEAQSEHEHPYK